jgi:hypothetical protein
MPVSYNFIAKRRVGYVRPTFLSVLAVAHCQTLVIEARASLLLTFWSTQSSVCVRSAQPELIVKEVQNKKKNI